MKSKKESWTQIRLTESEKKMLDRQAQKLGLSVSAYLRMLIYLEKKK